MVTFLIMAGGSGERFWPLSTKEKPKQLLKIFNEKSLLRLTFERILPIVDKSQIFIATNEIQSELVRLELPELSEDNIVIEPEFKDTAAAIIYGSMIISKYYNNPTIIVLASDHLISLEDKFREVLLKASLEALKENIVTIGIKPQYPEKGYGYIKVSDYEINMPTKALEFKEKPTFVTASFYVKSGQYLWDSGILAFTFNTLLKAFENHAKNHFYLINELSKLVNKNEGIITTNLVKDIYRKFDKISIDYAILENISNVIVIPADFNWNDIGNFTALSDILEKDTSDNVSKNINYISIDSKNNILIASNDNKINVSLLGVSNMIIAIQDEDILICDKHKAQEIKKIIKQISIK